MNKLKTYAHPFEFPFELVDIDVLAFPPELVSHILHYGCMISTSFCLALSLTSKWTRALALPYLFSTVVIKRLGTSAAFNKALSSYAKLILPPPKPNPAFLGGQGQGQGFDPKTHVKALWITAVSNQILGIFEACNGLRHLAVNANNLLWLAHASSPSQLRMSFLSREAIPRKPDLRVLVLDAKGANWSLSRFVPEQTQTQGNPGGAGNPTGPPPPPPTPLFAKITHMRLHNLTAYDSTHLSIAHYTRLTHLAIPYSDPSSQSLSDLDHLFTLPLTFLVLLVDVDELFPEEVSGAFAWVRETRGRVGWVYVMPAGSGVVDVQREWEGEVRGGLSVWVRAERFTRGLEEGGWVLSEEGGDGSEEGGDGSEEERMEVDGDSAISSSCN